MGIVALMTVSDGRALVHGDVAAFAGDVESKIFERLTEAGHVVIRAQEVIWTNELAISESRRLADARPDLTVINIPVWAFPHFTMLAASQTHSPLLLFSTVDPRYPGMVGMLAAAGALDQIGREYGRAWGEIADPAVQERIERHIRAGAAVNRLHGSTFGRIGGRPMGMYTAVSNTDEWMKRFGVDVEEIDQWELVRRSERIEPNRVRQAREWLEANVARIHYNEHLTPALLERQLRAYHAMRELIDEWHLDFCGIKAQPELTDNFCTMDVAEAFLNDPYDWEGSKTPIVCATEADMDGALTMQILRQLAGTPVLFADVRHYHADLDIWDLCNSGQHATWFAARSQDPMENLAQVQLFPGEFYFPAGGASVHHVAAAGDFTFARMTRADGSYRMQVIPGRLEKFDDATNERLMNASTYTWPHAFARLDADPNDILGRYASNHIHAIPGDYVEDLREVCRMLHVDFDLLRA